MSLTVVSTPIGDYEDITLRAKKTLEDAEIIICEELKPAEILFKRLGLEKKEFLQLNEHSKPDDIKVLVGLCEAKNVALISDCGTPGFYDPGAELVAACFDRGIKVNTNPGPSSLMALLSICGEKIKSFHFVGFLPAERSERGTAIDNLKRINVPLVIMDTPYRLKSTLQDFMDHDFGRRKAVVGADLTGPAHKLVRGTIEALAARDWQKLPFILLVLPR
jgi:16S rRNA (cytidine1402-2'-O)-methyltransferase